MSNFRHLVIRYWGLIGLIRAIRIIRNFKRSLWINRFKLDTRANETNAFSVVELLVVAGIIATLSVALVLNFRLGARTATARFQVASAIVSDIRKMQSRALAGRTYNGTIVCGYGVRYSTTNSYDLYAKPVPAVGSCASLATYNYQASDIIVETRKLVSTKMEIRSPFQNIFFLPPDPKVYINNVTLPTSAMTTITIQLVGQQNCAQGSCTRVEVYNSGQIDLR